MAIKSTRHEKKEPVVQVKPEGVESSDVPEAVKKVVPLGAVIISIGKSQVVFHTEKDGFQKASF